jgi:hypothetical protein
MNKWIAITGLLDIQCNVSLPIPGDPENDLEKDLARDRNILLAEERVYRERQIKVVDHGNFLQLRHQAIVSVRVAGIRMPIAVQCTVLWDLSGADRADPRCTVLCRHRTPFVHSTTQELIAVGVAAKARSDARVICTIVSILARCLPRAAASSIRERN